MAIEADDAVANAADAALAKGKNVGPAPRVPLAQGHVLRRRQGRDLRLQDCARCPTTTSTALQPLKDAGTVRLARCRWWSSPTARPAIIRATARCVTPGTSITSPAARRPAPAPRCAARLTLRRWAQIPAARSGIPRLRRYRLRPSGRPDEPRRRDAVVAIARYGRSARAKEDCALLVGLMAGADPGSDHLVHCRAGGSTMAAITGSLEGDSRAHRLLCMPMISNSKSRGCCNEDHRHA